MATIVGMRFLLALVVMTTLAACGGDSTPSSANYPPGSIQIYGPNGFPTQSVGVSFIAAQGSSTPSDQFVSFSKTPDVYATTSQTGEMFRYQLMDSGITITPATAPMDAGTYTGTILLNGCSLPSGWPCNPIAGSPKSINISYTVHGVSVTPSQLTFSSTGSNPATQTASLAVTSGSPSYTWQVSYSPSVAGWLQITPSSGTPDLSNGPQTVMFNVSAAGMPAGVYSAVVTFTTASSFSTRMTVTLSVGDPSVNFVAPYVVPAGAAGDVIIRGRGFSALTAAGLSVRFNSTPAVSASVVSDTEIRATYPSLAAGSYSISISSGAASIPSRAALKLVVVDPPAFPLTTIHRPISAGPPDNLIYDAERRALLFSDIHNNRILRYALDGSADASLDTGSPVGHIALSPDGTELIQTRPGQLQRLDPVTLAQLSPANAAITPSFWGLAFANDGGLVGSCSAHNIGNLCRYDLLTQAATPISFPFHMWYRDTFASADGRTLVLRYFSDTSDDTRIYTYDASTAVVTARPGTGPSDVRPFSVSRNGSRIVLANLSRTQRNAFTQVSTPSAQTTVYDAQFNALGTLPNDVNPVVLSPDGNFAYGYSAADGRVRKFSVSAAGGVSELGSASVVAPANTEIREMTISPDGGTLFLAGATSVVITPAP